MTQEPDELGRMIERGPSDEWNRKMPDLYIGLSPEKWDWRALGFEPEPGYGLDGYPLQLECNRRIREEAGK